MKNYEYIKKIFNYLPTQGNAPFGHDRLLFLMSCWVLLANISFSSFAFIFISEIVLFLVLSW